jgi:hypothetical protein
LLFDKKFLIQIVMAVLKGENLFHQMRGFLNILARVKSEGSEQSKLQPEESEMEFLSKFAKVIIN